MSIKSMETYTTDIPEYQKPDIQFAWTEYIFFGAVLAASLGIGVFYGFFGKKNKTNDEFLMAGRSMSILPVTLSLVCSFVSAITMLGNPVEIYTYGLQFTLLAIQFIPMTLALMYIYVPVYFRLQLTSAYEYFEWRFSRRVRMIMSVIAIVHLMFYMPTTVFGPSLALDQVAGISTTTSCAAIFVVCVAYSSLGGLKAVLWTDALQAGVMAVSLIAVIAAGMKEIGGFAVMWERAEATNRTELFDFDPDPRKRHTFFTSAIFGMFGWIPLFAATQAQIQRYNSVPTLNQSRKTLLFNMVGLMIIIILCSWIGLILFAKYYDCDPIGTKMVNSADQILPFFVMDVLGKYPGIPGIFVAGLTCGSLSSVSSALNSLTALITEDFVKFYRPGYSEERLAVISKIISTVSGIAAFGLVFIIAEVNKTVPILPLASLIHGSLIGPILGAFSLGMFFPWTEEIGTLLGLLISIVLTLFIGVGGILAGRSGTLPNQKLSLRTDGCLLVNDTERFHLFDADAEQHSLFLYGKSTNTYISDWKVDSANDSALLKLFSMSYMFQPVVGIFSCFILGMIFSGIIVALKKNRRPKINESLLSQPFLKLWKKLFGQEYLDKWVDFDSLPYTGDPVEKLKRKNAQINIKSEISTITYSVKE